MHDSAVVFSFLHPVPQFCLVSIGLKLQEDDAKFFEFSKSADDGSPRASRPSKTCPDVPNEFRVSGCKQESRLVIPLGLGKLMG